MVSRLAKGAPIAAILVLAAALRFVGTDLAREGGAFRPRLDGDGDVLYHAARARHLAATGSVEWVDPALDPPRGARVLWPPLLEVLIAGTAWIATAGTPTTAAVDAASALVPVGLGVACVAAAGALGALLLGPGGGLLTALGLAVSWSAIFYSMVGRTDQHVLEMLLFQCSLLLAAGSLRPSAPGAWPWRPLLLGLVLAASFWAWQGSALTLLLLSLAAAADHLTRAGGAAGPRLTAALALAASSGALAVGITVGLLGPEGALRSGAVEGISGLGVAACAGTSLGAGVLALAARRDRPPWVRAIEVVVAASLGAGALLAVAPLRDGVLHGLRPIGRSDGWHGVIHEFQPLFFGEFFTFSEDLGFALYSQGLVPFLALVGALQLPALARRAPERRAGLAFLGVIAAAVLTLWVARRRFDLYATVPLLLLAAAGARALSTRLFGARGPRWVLPGAVVVLLAAAAPTGVAIADLAREQEPGLAPVTRIATRLGQAVAAGAARPGVILSSWSRGHHVRFASGLPALVTPFGTDAGPGAMADWARFLLAPDEAAADAALGPRQVRWILLEPLAFDLLLAHRLEPGGPAPVERSAGGAILPRPEGSSLISVALYWRDGNGTLRQPALGGFRLVDEDFREGAPDEAAKLFERVPGARLTVTGAAPAARVVATVSLTLPTGRRSSLALEATADEAGRAALCLPYALSKNGSVEAGPWMISSQGTSSQLAVSEEAVLGGAALTLALRR